MRNQKKAASQSIWVVATLIIVVIIILLQTGILGNVFKRGKSIGECEQRGGDCVEVCGPGEQHVRFECEQKDRFCCIDVEKLLYGDGDDNETNIDDLTSLENQIKNLIEEIIQKGADEVGISATDLRLQVETGEVDIHDLNTYPHCNKKCDYDGYEEDLLILDALIEKHKEIIEKARTVKGFCLDQFSYTFEDDMPESDKKWMNVKYIEEGDVCRMGRSINPNKGADCGTNDEEPCYSDIKYFCEEDACSYKIKYYGFTSTGQPTTVNPTESLSIPTPDKRRCTENALEPTLESLQTHMSAPDECKEKELPISPVTNLVPYPAPSYITTPLYRIPAFSNIACTEAKYDDSCSLCGGDCTRKCVANEQLINALYQLNQHLKENGYKIKINDAFRTYEAQFCQRKALKSAACNPQTMENPNLGCKHMTGSAIDVAIVDRYDKETKEYRRLLEGLMCANGFIRLDFEHWHFEYGDGSSNWVNYQDKIGTGRKGCCYYQTSEGSSFDSANKACKS